MLTDELNSEGFCHPVHWYGQVPKGPGHCNRHLQYLQLNCGDLHLHLLCHDVLPHAAPDARTSYAWLTPWITLLQPSVAKRQSPHALAKVPTLLWRRAVV